MERKSPFQFLDAFEKKDKKMFFGRDAETKVLYTMTSETRLMLVYGASGSGKSSLVKCGLANQFKSTRWKDIYIRRDADIKKSIRTAIIQELKKLNDSLKEGESLVDGLMKIYKKSFKPVYLIFDQFEELFVLHPNKEEQQGYFGFIRDLMAAKLPCSAILIMREEFIAALWDFEQAVPSLFDHRFRVEKMRDKQIQEIISSMLNYLLKEGLIALDCKKEEEAQKEEISKLSELVFKNLSGETKEGDRKTVELTYLQVYLDRVYTEGFKNPKNDLPLITEEVISEQVGTVDDVIGDFLDDEIKKIEKPVGPMKRGQAIQFLGELISEEQTKRVLLQEDLQEIIQQKYGINPDQFNEYIETFRKMRIIKTYQTND